MVLLGHLVFGSLTIVLACVLLIVRIAWRRRAAEVLGRRRHFAAIAEGPVTLVGFWRHAGPRFLVEEALTGERAWIESGVSPALDDGEHVIVFGRAVGRARDQGSSYRQQAAPLWRVDLAGAGYAVWPDPDRFERRARYAEIAEPAALVGAIIGGSFLFVGLLVLAIG